MASSRQLPGMEDNKIEALEAAAHDYAKIRDKRQDLTKQEVDLKKDVMKLMKRHHKTKYVSDNVTIDLVSEEETVKVKVLKPRKKKETEDGE